MITKDSVTTKTKRTSTRRPSSAERGSEAMMNGARESSSTRAPTFTPGPWRVENTERSDLTITAEAGWIADVDLAGLISKEESRANSSLIAAAPDLLDLARLVLKEWEAPTEGVQRGELIARLSQYTAQARAVIAKAEGRS